MTEIIPEWQSIDLDCPPGATRPSDLIMRVVEGTPAEELTKPDDPASSFFGNWCWTYQIDREVWEREVQPVIKPRIEALYMAGVIRYGSW